MDSYTEGKIRQYASDHMERIDYSPVEEQRAIAIEDATQHCSSIFSSVNIDDIHRIVEQVWAEYLKNNEP